ncbi:uncharacterized protein PAC_20186 [Phialocephala subalpina]|uniref:Uncharacterized protein n=1 Tax=Phialocephala subalpina TaxID=576137 RepID=A0A1L7XZ32_9HELO|nr:uncharacterized protein PAC_20186 [Phialocephala subalpina]
MASPLNLVEVDTLTLTIIIDNEIDIMSTVSANTVSNKGRMSNLSLSQPNDVSGRGDCEKEMPMEAISCGAHGLSILLSLVRDELMLMNEKKTATKDEKGHSMLFDVGPEEDMWERNANGRNAQSNPNANLNPRNQLQNPVTIDLHPSRPTHRGFMAGNTPISMQAESSFPEIEALGAVIETHSEPHTVLDDFFLVSGEVPRVTSYETNVKGGIRFEEETGKWEKDEEIKDEKFLVVNLKDIRLRFRKREFQCLRKRSNPFTGCSYGIVVNASLDALSLLNNTVPLHAILGGYHVVGEQKANVKDTL